MNNNKYMNINIKPAVNVDTNNLFNEYSDDYSLSNNYENYDSYTNLIDILYNDDDSNIKNDHKSMWCEKCNNDHNIIEDTSHGFLVCTGCAQVISTLVDANPEWTQYNDDNKKDMNRCSLPISKLLPQSSTATTIGGGCSSRIKTLHSWSAMPYKERSLNEVFKIIQIKCAEGKIMKCIEDDAKIMYKNISDCKHKIGKNMDKNIIIRGINRKSLIAACVLYACRKKDKTRSPKEIAELFELKYTQITKGCKTFSKMAKLKNMELKLNSTKPEHFITRFCDELKIKKEYALQSIQIANNVQKLHIASVHTPLSLATGSIYLMIHLNRLNIQKKTIAEKFNVSQVTIAKAFKKLEPFINILTNDDICNQLNKEIIKYQEDIKIDDRLKPKFIRFGISKNILKNCKKDIINNIFNIYDKETNTFNDQLIIEHTIEIANQIYQQDNEFIRLNLAHGDYLYSLCSNMNKLII